MISLTNIVIGLALLGFVAFGLWALWIKMLPETPR